MLSKGKEIVTGKGKRKLEIDSLASSGCRKRKNSDGVLRFLDISANVADSSSIDSFVDDRNDYLEDEICSTAIVKQETETAVDIPFLKNVEDMSTDELERMVAERYRPGSSLITYAEDEAEELSEQNKEIPSNLEDTSLSKVPIIWKVKCTVGREINSAVCLMQKFVELQNLRKKLHIVSAFAVEHVKGSIYIEAYRQCDVYEACYGICSTYPQGMVPVPKKELSRLFNVRRRLSNISTGTWIRLKKGKYKGDLAQVVAVRDSTKKATLKLIPRIDLQAVREKLLGGVSGKKTAVTAQKLINSNELEEFRPMIKCRKDRDTNEVFEILDGKMLKGGYLYKKVSVGSLSCCVVQPSEDDLLKFEHSMNEDPDDQEWLFELFGEQKKRRVLKSDNLNGEGEDSSSTSMEDVFKFHDIILFREKEFGFIISIDNGDSCKVLTESSEGRSVVDLKLCDIKKLSCEKKFTALDHQHNIISTNSRVNVVEGPLQGRVGIVKHIYRGTIFVHDETDLENGGYFCCKSQTCEKIKNSGVSSKDKKGGELVALGTDDVSSSLKSYLLPLKSTKESINSWKSPNLEITEISGVPSKDKGGEVEVLGTDDLHSSSKPPLSTKQAPKERTDSRKFYLGGNDVTFTVGQSLKIRMGPLKGYRCQIMALSHSEIMVKLDSQPNTLAVKPEHLAGGHVRNDNISTKPSGQAGGQKTQNSSTDKVKWKSDAGGKAAENFRSEGWSKTFARGSGSGGRSGRGGGRGESGRGRGGGRGECGRGRGSGRGGSGRGRGGRGYGRGEFGRGKGEGLGESRRGRGDGQGEFGRGRGGGQGEFGRGRGGGQGEFGRGRGGGRGEFGSGRGGGQGEFGRGRGGGRGEFGRGRGGGQGGVNQSNMGRGGAHGGENQFNMGRGNTRGGMKQLFNIGRGNGQGGQSYNLGGRTGRGGTRGGRGQFGRGISFNRGESPASKRENKQKYCANSGMQMGNRSNRNGSQAEAIGWQSAAGEIGNQMRSRFSGASNVGMQGSGQGGQSYGLGGKTGRGGTRGGRGQFGRGTSSDRGNFLGWKGDNEQTYCANSGMQMGSPSNRNGSQAGAIGWQSAASETGNQMRSRFSGASNAGMHGNAEAIGRKRGAEMMGDQSKSWGNKKWQQ